MRSGARVDFKTIVAVLCVSFATFAIKCAGGSLAAHRVRITRVVLFARVNLVTFVEIDGVSAVS